MVASLTLVHDRYHEMRKSQTNDSKGRRDRLKFCRRWNLIGVPVDKFLVNLFYSSAKMIKNTCWAQVPTILNAFIFGLKKLQWLADLDYAFSLSTGTAKNPADVRLIMH
ncbi:hypothetical protein D5086_010007 [Populus alba]|uniref:Uncharacterized protein n=1 Tax=Populus alba TaxID=43335 RepID=A0ACC4C857_POPAL